MLVGDYASLDDERVGRPFVGLAGFHLDRVLRRAGFNRDQFASHNVLSCRPPAPLIGASFEAEALKECAPYLDRTIQEKHPRAIVAFGNVALQRLVEGADGISRHRGFVHIGKHGLPVVGTYHPSFLLPRDGQANTSRFVGVVLRDLRRAVAIAQNGFVRSTPYYVQDDAAALFGFVLEYEHALENNPDLYLAFDIETPYKLTADDEDDVPDDTDQEGRPIDETKGDNPLPTDEPILRISFAFREGYAISVPWAAPYMTAIKRLLASKGRKATWNGVRFDVPVLRAHGYEVRGRIYDFMWAFHVWQSDLPKGLEFAASFFTDLLPWKHKSDAEPALYSAIDADATIKNVIGLERELRANGQWEMFERHVTDLDPLLVDLGVHGVKIDSKAQDALRLELEGERDRIVKAAQDAVPDSLRPRTEYKRLPKGESTFRGTSTHIFTRDEQTSPWREFEPRWITADIKVCSHCDKPVSNKSEHLKGGKTNPCAVAKAVLVKEPGAVQVYDEVEDFNPNSVKHLLSYADFHHHPVPVNHKTARPTMDKLTIERLSKRYSQKKHPIYPLALKLRGVKKTLGTYVEGFKPDESGLIHTTLGHWPSSGRLSSRNVNLQNVSHRSGAAYADRVRQTIVPRPGFVFVEADSSAIEAVMTGYFMGSQEYIDLAKRGIHDYLSCLEVGIDFTKAAIAEFKQTNAALYEDIRNRKKRTVHGVSYGMTAYLLHQTYPNIFPTIASAQASIDHFLAACPGLFAWQHEVRVRAYKASYLENPWHYRHYFYDVFAGKNKETGAYLLGADAKRAVSFLPQSSAAAFMKDNILHIAKSRFWPMPAIGVVHDSYALEVREADVEEAKDLLISVLTRPIPEMDGLTIGAEVKLYTANWNESSVIAKAA